ncbi:hypothetical protein OH76DRAFT_1423217 [Lentinus brumalis]|uniref:Uncharacterized protein n=1 Tax=Lentinus brumalis TaxID=2498619 RepID=A0A371CLV9_9APHY|nr:hypothetical protein OH76DRAFT_1423217 [Polyporus brumalis]
MSHSANSYPGVPPTHPEGSNNPGTGGSAWGTAPQQPTWGTQWGPAPPNPGDGPRGGGGYMAGPPPTYATTQNPMTQNQTPSYVPAAPPATVAPSDEAWRVALQTMRELTEALRARTVDLANRNAQLERSNTQLEVEVQQFRNREASLAARELEVARREGDLQNRSQAPSRFSSRGGRPFAHPRVGATSRPNTSWSALQSQPSSSSATTASGPPSSAVSTAATDATTDIGRAPSVVPQKREREPDEEDHDDNVVISVGNNAVGLARAPAPSQTAEALVGLGDTFELNDPLKSSEYVFAGKPDPSVEGHPRSRWYTWFRSANQGDLIDAVVEDKPYDEETGPIPYNLPDWVTEDIGEEAEEKEKRRVARVRGKGSRPPAPVPRHDGDCGPWENLEIVTAHQAHNLRHLAAHEQNPDAARFYRRLIVLTQDPTRYRTEGMRYLMKAWQYDVKKLPPAAPLALPPSTTTEETPDPMTVPGLRIIPVEADPAQSWLTRSRVGRNRALNTLPSVDAAIEHFTNIDTTEWPVGMRTKANTLPSATTVRSLPNAADVVAESFIAAILPVIPDGEVERFGESAFFRGLIELLSIDGALAWIVSVGGYHRLLLEEPAPYPHDCRELRYDHIAAWVTSHAHLSFGEIHPVLYTYARNTRVRLEGLPVGVTSFRTIPRNLDDIKHESYASRIPRDDLVLAIPEKDYAAVHDVEMDEPQVAGGAAGPSTASPDA